MNYLHAIQMGNIFVIIPNTNLGHFVGLFAISMHILNWMIFNIFSNSLNDVLQTPVFCLFREEFNDNSIVKKGNHQLRLKKLKRKFNICMKWTRRFVIQSDLIHGSCIGIEQYLQVKQTESSEIYLFILIWTLVWSYCVHLILLNVVILSIICYFIIEHCRMKTKEYNEQLIQIEKKIQLSEEEILFVIEEHNKICLRIKSYNNFCSKFYFVNFITLFPTSHITIMLFFEVASNFWKPLIFLYISLTWMFIFFITFISASLSKSIHSSHQIMSKLQWKINLSKNASISGQK
jgi:hypothetical protein